MPRVVVCSGSALLRWFRFVFVCLSCAFSAALLAAPDAAVSDWGACAADPLPPLEIPAAATATDEEFEVFSGKAEFKLDGDAKFSDQIILRSGNRLLRADDASYDSASGVFAVQGDVEFRDPQTRVSATKARLDRVNSELSFESAEFEIWSVPARGSARDVNVQQAGIFQLREATYTSCPKGNNDWQLSAKKIHINQNTGVGTARNARLDFKGVPILWLPYITYPVTNERKSGLLIPDLGSSNRRGLDIATPYYWNIAPNYDATITPRYMSKRGLQMNGEFRYLQPRHTGALNGEYLADDEPTGENRYLISVFNQSRLWGGWRGTLDYIDVSDSAYFDDFSSGIAATSQSNLERSLGFEYFNNPWSVMFRVQDYETIDESITDFEQPYQRLPQLAVRGHSPQGLFGLRYDLVGDMTYFDRDVGVTGFRAHLAPEVGLPLGFDYFQLEPAIGAAYSSYNLADTAPGEEDNPDFLVPIYSLDLASTFERTTGNSKWLQTLEPRALYTYIPFENQDDIPVFDSVESDLNVVQLFRNNRYVGYDRVGDTNQIALGITTRLLDADNGKEFMRATLGNIRYLSDQKVTLPGGMPNESSSSDYLAEFATRFLDHWGMNLGYQWDSDNNETIRTEARLQYRPDATRVANLSYRFRRDTLKEIDFAVAWPLWKSWNFVGRYNYSLEDNQPLEQFIGLEYETCCWGIRGVWREYLTRPTSEFVKSDSDTSFSVQLVLKGFSSVGNSADRLLDRGILGYD